MNLLNQIEVETRWGYRTFELYHGDITRLDFAVDVLAISAFKGNYDCVPGTVVGALNETGSNVAAMSGRREYDFVDALGCWVAQGPPGANFKRLLCAEFVGGRFDLVEVMENVFVVLSILGMKGLEVRTLALPMLGAGHQQQPLPDVIGGLLGNSLRHMERSPYLERILFVEYREDRALAFDRAMNDTLGRVKVVLPKGELFDGLRADILKSVDRAREIAGDAKRDLFNDARRLIASGEARSFELGILSRRLVEFMADDLLRDQQRFDLLGKIDALGKQGIADWIRSYMHVLRVLGNESAHEKEKGDRKPATIMEADMALCLSCLRRLLEFWVDYRKQHPAAP